MPQIKSSFILNSSEPNFTRDRYSTLSEMAMVQPGSIDVGHISFCAETNKHYVYLESNPNNYSASTGGFRELELHDTLEVNTINDLKNYPGADALPLGKLVYCKADDQVYYKCNSWQDTTGYFKLLIDLQDSSYVSFESEEWQDLTEVVETLANASMLVYDTVQEMAAAEPSEVMNEGQLAYCKELDRHFYLIKNSQGEYVHDGYYGYFRLVCDADAVEPIITQPSARVEVEYNSEYSINGWQCVTRGDQTILLITDESTVPNIHAVSSVIDRGEIDYTGFPYLIGDRTVPYIGTSDLTSDMYKRDNVDVYGDNEYYVAVKASTDIPTPIDINGIEREDLKWDQTQTVESNSIIVNKTKEWKASTSTTLEVQPLIPWQSEMIGYAKLVPTCQYTQEFEIPEGRTLQSLYIKGLAGYVEEDMNEWRQASNKFTYIGSPRGEVEIKVVF